MGSLNLDGVVPILLDDDLLDHVFVVITTKLRRRSGFTSNNASPFKSLARRPIGVMRTSRRVSVFSSTRLPSVSTTTRRSPMAVA